MTTIRDALLIVRGELELPSYMFCSLHSRGFIHDDGTLTPIANRMLDGLATEEDKRVLFPWIYEYPDIMRPIVDYHGKYEAMRK